MNNKIESLEKVIIEKEEQIWQLNSDKYDMEEKIEQISHKLKSLIVEGNFLEEDKKFEFLEISARTNRSNCGVVFDLFEKLSVIKNT